MLLCALCLCIHPTGASASNPLSPLGSLFVVVPAQNFRGSWVLISSTNSGKSEGLES